MYVVLKKRKTVSKKETKNSTRENFPSAFTAAGAKRSPRSPWRIRNPKSSSTPLDTSVRVPRRVAGCSQRGDDNDLPRSGHGRSRRAFDTLDAQVNCSREPRRLRLVLSGRSWWTRLARKDGEDETRGRRDMPARWHGHVDIESMCRSRHELRGISKRVVEHHWREKRGATRSDWYRGRGCWWGRRKW